MNCIADIDQYTKRVLQQHIPCNYTSGVWCVQSCPYLANVERLFPIENKNTARKKTRNWMLPM